MLPIPLNPPGPDIRRRDRLVRLAGELAPREGYNSTRIPGVRILRSEAALRDVPVLYKPGAVFVLQGRKQGLLEGEVYLYDEEHYLAVSVPVPFRMESRASREAPLLAVYVEFDMRLAIGVASQVWELRPAAAAGKARGLVSSPMEPCIEDVLLRLLCALRDPVEVAVLGEGLVRELYYRVFVGPQGGAMVAALRQRGASSRIAQSIALLRENYASPVTVAALARQAGMSAPAYHVHFRSLTGSTPMQYVKALRLHEARLMIARRDRTIAEIAVQVGYSSPAHFSRDFRRRFGRAASEEAEWVRRHIGELA